MQTATLPINVDVHNIHNVLRATENFQEILTNVLEIFSKKSPIIWQKNSKGERKMAKAHIVDFDASGGQIIIKRADSKNWTDFRNRISLYFKGDDHSIGFKIADYHRSEDTISIKIPTSIRIIEKRVTHRIHFVQKDKSILANVTKKSLAGTPYAFDVIDISERGMAMMIPSYLAKNFYQDDIVNINKIDGLPMNGLQGRVVYIKIVKNHSFGKQLCRLGLSFEEVLDDKVFKTIIEHIT
jgi:c-di-GMP-binding flagellar brake protein YcgR